MALHRYPGDGYFRFHRHLHGSEGRLALDPRSSVRLFFLGGSRIISIISSSVFAGSARALLVWNLGAFFLLVVMGL